MSEGRPRKTPRATRSMVDLFQVIATCGDVLEGWDLSTRAEGHLLRARSRERYPTEQTALEAAQKIAVRVTPVGYEVGELLVSGRPDGNPAREWQAVLEVLLRPVQA